MELETHNKLFEQMSVSVISPSKLAVSELQASLSNSLDRPKGADCANKSALIVSESVPEQLTIVEQSHSSSSADQPSGKHLSAALTESRLTCSTPEEEASRKVQAKDKVEASQSTLTSTSTTRRALSESQLASFVFAQVPRNKRVLCLIIRNKMSSLGLAKAKSYFYPTYYLFVQTIIDLDEDSTSSSSQQVELEANQLSDSNDDDLFAANANNSFSASSSISADMLFIGPTEGNNLRVSCNSYSDNELAVDELDEPIVKRSPRRLNQSSFQARDSPLVFPREVREVKNVDCASSIDDSNDEDDDSDNDESHYGKSNRAISGGKLDEDDEEVDGGESERFLFDNDKNPFTGATGILLSGRRRKKAKTLVSHSCLLAACCCCCCCL